MTRAGSACAAAGLAVGFLAGCGGAPPNAVPPPTGQSAPAPGSAVPSPSVPGDPAAEPPTEDQPTVTAQPAPPTAAPSRTSTPKPNPLASAIVEDVMGLRADIAVFEPGYVNLPTGLNATRSSDAAGYIDRYEWDFNNDGVFDKTTPGGNVLHTFTKLGPTTVTVKVTNNVGRTATASVTFTVVKPPAGYPTRKPFTPSAPTVTTGPKYTLILTLPPNRTGVPVDYYRIVNVETGWTVVPWALAPKNPAKPFVLDMDAVYILGTQDGTQSYRFRVEAQNALGWSKPSRPSKPVTPKR